MKQYIKPTTVVEMVALSKMIATSGPDVLSDSADQDRGMDTKSRDVWSEGFW